MVTYTYRLCAKGAAKQLLVIVQSSPLISDEKLGLYLRRFGVVKKVVTKSHHFNHNHQIDSGLRRIILLLNEDVETRQRPTASGGNIFSKERIFTAADAIVNGPFHEGFPSE